MSKQLAGYGQVLAGHVGPAGHRVPEVVEAQPAGSGIGAYRPPAVREAPFAPNPGVAQEQKRVGVVRARQRGDERPRGLAEPCKTLGRADWR